SRRVTFRTLSAELPGGDLVGREHGGQGFVAGGLDLARHGPVPRAAVAFRERLVGDLAHHALEEPDLAALWRTRVVLAPQELPATEVVQASLDGGDLFASHTGQIRGQERDAEHRRVLERGAL